MCFQVLIWKYIMYDLWNYNGKRLIIQSDRLLRPTCKELSLRILLASISGLTVYLRDWNIIRVRLISTRPRITQSVEWLSYGLKDRKIVFRFPTKARDLSLSHSVQSGCGTHQTPVKGQYLLWVKRPVCEAETYVRQLPRPVIYGAITALFYTPSCCGA
jgi:hypothetical protein